MKILLVIFLILSSCTKKSDSEPEAVAVNPNTALEASKATCDKIKAKMFADYFIDMKPDVLFLSGGNPYFIDPQGNMNQFMDGDIPLGTFCTLEIAAGTITGVL